MNTNNPTNNGSSGNSSGQNTPDITNLGQPAGTPDLPFDLSDIVVDDPAQGGNNPPGTPPANPPANVNPGTPQNSTGDDSGSNPNNPVPPVGNEVEALFNSLFDANAPDEVKQQRNILLTTFKGANFDNNGNILNDKNEIVFSAQNIKDYLKDETLPLDDKGNVVNLKGEIIIPSTQLVEQNSVIAPIKQSLENNFGIQLPADFKVEENEQGLLQLVDTVVKTATANSVSKYLESNPIVKSFVDHLLLGGQPENFVNTHIDYKAVDIKNLTDVQKQEFLNKAYTKQNNPSKDRLINILMNSGKDILDEQVSDAIKYLDAEQQKENLARQATLENQAREEQEKIETYWKTVENTVLKTGRLSDINIPLAERQGFYDYLSKPVNKEMYSQDMIDAENDSLDFNLLVSYLRYKKTDFAYLASLKAKEIKVDNLKERFKRLSSISGNGVQPITHNHNGNNPSDISLETILQ